MTAIRSGAELASVLGGRRLADYGVILDLHVQREEAGATQRSRLTLRVATADLAREIRIRLDGVQDLHLSRSWVSGIQGLYLEDVSGRQWDGVRWELGDSEDECLGCTAASLDLGLVDGTRP